MKYTSEIFLPITIKNAMGMDWKRAMASSAFDSLTKNSGWDGQRVSFKFVPIIRDNEEIGTEIQAFFYSEVMI